MRRRAPGVLRIVGGRWRSRLVAFDPACGLRPTPDRVRQTLFDWLAPTIQGMRCLDLYAGSGALGLEALSRGAASVVFVERDVAQVAMLRRTISQLAADTSARVMHGEALTELGRLIGREQFDAVFLDPPYADDALPAALATLPAVLAPFNRVYLEWSRQRPQVLPAGYALLREKQAGQVSYGLATYDSGKGDGP